MTNEQKNLKLLAETVAGWGNCNQAWLDQSEDVPAAVVGHIGEDGETYPVAMVDCDQYYAAQDSLKLAKFYAAANPTAVLLLLSTIDEQEREIETLKRKLAEHQAAFVRMGYVGRVDGKEELELLLSEARKVPEWKPLTNYGQVKVGDRIMFELCGTTVKRTIGEILFGGTDKEEMIYDRRRNYYIITSMALKGEGSQKNVRYFPKSAQPKEPKQ